MRACERVWRMLSDVRKLYKRDGERSSRGLEATARELVDPTGCVRGGVTRRRRAPRAQQRAPDRAPPTAVESVAPNWRLAPSGRA